MSKRIKIGLCCRHNGLTQVLWDLWSPRFDVRLREVKNKPPWQGDEDIYVSTLHHYDMLNATELEDIRREHGDYVFRGLSPQLLQHTWDGRKPLIMYVTDPVIINAQRAVADRYANKPWFHAVGAENCYAAEEVVPVSEYIPFAIEPTGYPAYTGTIKDVLVVQKHPWERLRQSIRAWKQPEPASLEQFFGATPHTVARQPSIRRFRLMYSEYRVLAYWSNSPYTIVLFEAMTAGIPIVAYRSPCKGPDEPVMKYLPANHVHTDRDAMIRQLHHYLNLEAPPPPQTYNFAAYPEVQRKWVDLITSIVGD